MTDIIKRLRAAVPTHEGVPIAWPCIIRSELLLEAAAEVERQARHIEELREKIDAERSCACSFDAPGDVCVAHSPALAEARAEVERLQAVVATLEIVGKAADDERQTMRERIEQLHEIIENNGVPCVIRRLL